MTAVQSSLLLSAVSYFLEGWHKSWPFRSASTAVNTHIRAIATFAHWAAPCADHKDLLPMLCCAQLSTEPTYVGLLHVDGTVQ